MSPRHTTESCLAVREVLNRVGDKWSVQIVQLLAEGLSTEVIANRIGLSVETVKADTKRVIGKLQADTRTHAVAIALRQSLID